MRFVFVVHFVVVVVVVVMVVCVFFSCSPAASSFFRNRNESETQSSPIANRPVWLPCARLMSD